PRAELPLLRPPGRRPPPAAGAGRAHRSRAGRAGRPQPRRDRDAARKEGDRLKPVVSTEGRRPERRDLLSTLSPLSWKQGLSAPRVALRSRRRKLWITNPLSSRSQRGTFQAADNHFL